MPSEDTTEFKKKGFVHIDVPLWLVFALLTPATGITAFDHFFPREAQSPPALADAVKELSADVKDLTHQLAGMNNRLVRVETRMEDDRSRK